MKKQPTSINKSNIILIVLLVAALGAAGWFWWQNRQATSNLETGEEVGSARQDSQSPTAGSALQEQDSSVPSDWKRWTHNEFDISFQLPPNWTLEGSTVYYERDVAFKPERAILRRDKYEGGSRREQYIAMFNDYNECEPELTNNTSVKGMVISGLSVLLLTRKDTEKACGVNPAFVFVKDNWLYSFQLSRGEGGGLDFWNESAYMAPYYKIIASIK